MLHVVQVGQAPDDGSSSAEDAVVFSKTCLLRLPLGSYRIEGSTNQMHDQEKEAGWAKQFYVDFMESVVHMSARQREL